MEDRFGKDISALADKKLFIFDMDGTIYTEGVLYEHVLDLMARIRERGGDYVFFTNNSSKSVGEYIARIQGMGIPVTERNFSTSVDASISYLREHHAGELVHCMGTASLVAGLEAAGISVTREVDEDATVVLLGFDTELTFEKIRKVSEMLTHDVAYLATNTDWACPTSFGFVPDCAAMATMLKAATNKMPRFLGKPEPFMVYAAMEEHGATAAETLVVGDRLYTDIACGANAGVDSLCVLTGEASLEDVRASDVAPTYTVDSITQLYQVL